VGNHTRITPMGVGSHTRITPMTSLLRVSLYLSPSNEEKYFEVQDIETDQTDHQGMHKFRYVTTMSHA
jgi:hypothetical protein